MRLWRNDPNIKGGKYLVQRRDGTVPDWPWFVLGAKDPAAPAALRAYAHEAEMCGMDAEYCMDIRHMADEWELYRLNEGDGDPDAAPHRKDDPAVVERMANSLGS